MKTVMYLAMILTTAQVTLAMREPTTQEYSQTIQDIIKKLVLIKAITVNGKAPHINVEPSESEMGVVNAVVNSADIAQQERQHTEHDFFPFFVDEGVQKVTIKPHVSGTYTVQLPVKTQFTVDNPKGTTIIHKDMITFHMEKK